MKSRRALAIARSLTISRVASAALLALNHSKDKFEADLRRSEPKRAEAALASAKAAADAAAKAGKRQRTIEQYTPSDRHRFSNGLLLSVEKEIHLTKDDTLPSTWTYGLVIAADHTTVPGKPLV